MRRGKKGTALDSQGQLFLSLVEQLTRPLLQISQLAELGIDDDPGQVLEHWSTVHAISQASLRLVENYALSLQVQGRIVPLNFEPITVSSLLYDTAQTLQPFAQQYGVLLDIDSGQRMQPILADRAVLQAAMTSLGQVFIFGQSQSEDTSVVHLSGHRSRYGPVVGLYSPTLELGKDDLRRARGFNAGVREPLQRLVSGPAAGVFIADSLLGTLATRLHVARYRSLTGLAATLQSSQQLQLV